MLVKRRVGLLRCGRHAFSSEGGLSRGGPVAKKRPRKKVLDLVLVCGQDDRLRVVGDLTLARGLKTTPSHLRPRKMAEAAVFQGYGGRNQCCNS